MKEVLLFVIFRRRGYVILCRVIRGSVRVVSEVEGVKENVWFFFYCGCFVKEWTR